ncbi:MAG: hypothetical protein HF314_11675 [Ignavibacteria bacterium]|jgi:hypothetical protein|nr:hypothetical protein [Ignavibacteria bacterium]MCU7503729.1 hypothetical protein [Ignavibacteria bacterium]MCU7517625.1 hypothetical protein [Ignavibacteria bacterium]
MQFIIILLSIFLISNLFSIENPYKAIPISVLIQLIFVIGYIVKIKKAKIIKSFLTPFSMFYFVFFLYSIIGQLVWLYRDIYWFNEVGDPIPVIKIYMIAAVLLYVASLIHYTSIAPKVSRINISDKIIHLDNSLNKISNVKLLFIFFLGLVGTYIFTSGFKYIPIFSSDMSQTRLDLQESNIGGKGFGFIFMLGLLHGVVFIYDRLKKSIKIGNKIIYGFLLILFYFPLTLYSGRLLLLIPIVLIIIKRLIEKEKIRYIQIILLMSISIILYYVVMYFGAVRFFGKGVSDELVVRYLWGDIFPEFRMFVYFNHISETNLMNVVYGTFFSGLIPGFLFDLVGIDKSEFYITIGKYVQSHMGHLGINLGIRMSLIGELYMAGGILSLLISFSIILVVLHFIDKNFLLQKSFTDVKYITLLIGIFLALCIPYGTLFLSSTIQFAVFTILIKYVRI